MVFLWFSYVNLPEGNPCINNTALPIPGTILLGRGLVISVAVAVAVVKKRTVQCGPWIIFLWSMENHTMWGPHLR